MLGDGARAPHLERAWTPRARPDVLHLREGPPVSQVDPTMPSDCDRANTGPQGSSATLPDHDLCIAGFPCQPFSSMGRRDGLQNSRGRGQKIIVRITKAFSTKKPRAVLLVNVESLLSCHPEALRIIFRRRRTVGRIYDVGHRVPDTAKHGSPQHRERVFVIGIRGRNSQPESRSEFCWPRPVACRQSPACWTPAGRLGCSEAQLNFLAT
jgi:site-specific DNA-cytosine methylase